MNLSFSSYTDPGDRPVNEDSIGIFHRDESHCFVLCDGLGGHGMGDTASSMVRDIFKEQFQKSDDAVNFIGETLLIAEEELLEEQRTRRVGHKMKTTATVVVTDEKTAYIGFVGDSRAYVFRHNRVKTRTSDHSVPQMLAIAGEIKESEIRNHPDRSILLRVMGIPWDEPMYELLTPIPLKKCQAMLLCSDGFWELVDEKTMCELLRKSKTVGEWLDLMRDVVAKNGIGKSMDNHSAIAIWFQ